MLGRRAFLGFAAASAGAWTLGRAHASGGGLVEIRISLSLPTTKGEAWVQVMPPSPGGLLLAAETHVEGDADVLTFEGREVAARWRAGAISPRMTVVTRAAAAGPLSLEQLAIAAPRVETLSGPVDWARPAGARWFVELAEIMA